MKPGNKRGLDSNTLDIRLRDIWPSIVTTFKLAFSNVRSAKRHESGYSLTYSSSNSNSSVSLNISVEEHRYKIHFKGWRIGIDSVYLCKYEKDPDKLESRVYGILENFEAKLSEQSKQ